MMVYGITGGIGSGKSTVADLLRAYAPMIDADQLARDVVEPGSEGMRRLVERFGEEIVSSDGSLKRQALGKRIAEDAKAKADLDQLLHPLIKQCFEDQISAYEQAGEPFVFYDCPLLIEAGQVADVDYVILVTADEATRVQRIMARDMVDATTARQKIAIQMPEEEKRAYADVVIENNGSKADLERAVAAWWHTQKNFQKKLDF